MARYLYIVSRDQPLVYGCLVTQQGAPGRGTSAEVIFDRRRRGSDASSVDPPEWTGAERRRQGQVEDALLSQGYALVRISGSRRSTLIEALEDIDHEPLGLTSRRRRWRLAGMVCAGVLGVGLLIAGALVKPAGDPGSVARLDAPLQAGSGGPGRGALDRAGEAAPPGSTTSVPNEASPPARLEPAPPVPTTGPDHMVGRPEERSEPREDERVQDQVTGAPQSPSPGLSLPDRDVASEVPSGRIQAGATMPALPHPARDPVAAAGGAASSPEMPARAARAAPEAPARPSPAPRAAELPRTPEPAVPEIAATASLPSVPVGLPHVEISREGGSGGRGKVYSISLSDVEGHPVGGAEVWMLGRLPDGKEMQTRLAPGSSAGLYRGSVPAIEAEGEAQLTVRVVLRTLRFEVPVIE
ncbi:MAG TPA: hypothetical protein VM778_06455 [Gemmatimonadota bacterium]|nr:hypothetical protein [Gemmatimonadota bacterium]